MYIYRKKEYTDYLEQAMEPEYHKLYTEALLNITDSSGIGMTNEKEEK